MFLCEENILNTNYQSNNIETLYNEFVNKYKQYKSAIDNLLFVRSISNYFFNDFPNNLPSELKLEIELQPKLIFGLIKGEYTLKKKNDNELTIEIVDLDGNKRKVQNGLVEILGSSISFLDYKIVNDEYIVKFRETISDELIELSNSKAFVMLYSYFDSYLKDCLYYIFKVKPEKWHKSHVKLSFNEIKQNITEDQVIEKHIEENFSRNICTFMDSVYKNLNNRSDSLFSKEQLKLLEENVEVRNILIHNFGIIDNKFKKKVDTILEIGEKFPITHSYVIRTFYLINDLMLGIYNEITISVFKMDIGEIIKEQIAKNK